MKIIFHREDVRIESSKDIDDAISFLEGEYAYIEGNLQNYNEQNEEEHIMQQFEERGWDRAFQIEMQNLFAETNGITLLKAIMILINNLTKRKFRNIVILEKERAIFTYNIANTIDYLFKAILELQLSKKIYYDDIIEIKEATEDATSVEELNQILEDNEIEIKVLEGGVYYGI